MKCRGDSIHNQRVMRDKCIALVKKHEGELTSNPLGRLTVEKQKELLSQQEQEKSCETCPNATANVRAVASNVEQIVGPSESKKGNV